MGGTKQVRVDNWGIFFLQRLHLFFNKTDYCDLTLQFDGNVQLKVHRLVMNACTTYFQFLEQTCTVDDNVIMMPSDLQPDTIVPIVNFMYTGMLEFNMDIFDKLHETAALMKISILTKLLDAQRQPSAVRQKEDSGVRKKITPNRRELVDLSRPSKPMPVAANRSFSPCEPSTSTAVHDSKWVSTAWQSRLSNTISSEPPRPTRFDWPDDVEPPPAVPLDASQFGDISLTSDPLLTKNDVLLPPRKETPPPQNLQQRIRIVERKVRSKRQANADEMHGADDVEDLDYDPTDPNGKRKSLNVRQNKRAKAKATIVNAEKNSDKEQLPKFDRDRLVADILKKFPNLVKSNQNIRVKVLPRPLIANDKAKASISSAQPLAENETDKQSSSCSSSTSSNTSPVQIKDPTEGPWVCSVCSSGANTVHVEFALYYLFRKHMTEIHNQEFDSKQCRYCGMACPSVNILNYHLFTKHSMRTQSTPASGKYPTCSRCPFVAISEAHLMFHKTYQHRDSDVQCFECGLAFDSVQKLGNHVQITDHMGRSLPKTKQSQHYGCQYCTKASTSALSLLYHVRKAHKMEAMRDGILSLDFDNMDELSKFDEDGNREIKEAPNNITDKSSSIDHLPSNDNCQNIQEKSVNILSDVKLSSEESQNRQSDTACITLDMNSADEPTDNVSPSISNNIGLVDIVLVNDQDQSIIIEQIDNDVQITDTSNDATGALEAQPTGDSEMIHLVHEQEDGISISNPAGESSTDELVMVLSDKDFDAQKNNKSDSSNIDKSNIVVLYSHPVNRALDEQQQVSRDGDGDNGNDEANGVSTVIESIELIEKEVHKESECKQSNNSSNDVNAVTVINLTETEKAQLEEFCAERSSLVSTNNEVEKTSAECTHKTESNPSKIDVVETHDLVVIDECTGDEDDHYDANGTHKEHVTGKNKERQIKIPRANRVLTASTTGKRITRQQTKENIAATNYDSDSIYRNCTRAKDKNLEKRIKSSIIADWKDDEPDGSGNNENIVQEEQEESGTKRPSVPDENECVIASKRLRTMQKLVSEWTDDEDDEDHSLKSVKN